jgi:hypothetical protein
MVIKGFVQRLVAEAAKLSAEGIRSTVDKVDYKVLVEMLHYLKGENNNKDVLNIAKDVLRQKLSDKNPDELVNILNEEDFAPSVYIVAAEQLIRKAESGSYNLTEKLPSLSDDAVAFLVAASHENSAVSKKIVEHMKSLAESWKFGDIVDLLFSYKSEGFANIDIDHTAQPNV